MIYKIKLRSSVEKVIAKWKKSNPSNNRKLLKILEELMIHPREGIGHPEALIGGNNIKWSRHITAHDRIIYNIYDDVVVVEGIQIEGHYKDK